MSSFNAKGRKIGRNAKWCQVYRASGVRERNKRMKRARHVKVHPNDLLAVKREF